MGSQTAVQDRLERRTAAMLSDSGKPGARRERSVRSSTGRCRGIPTASPTPSGNNWRRSRASPRWLLSTPRPTRRRCSSTTGTATGSLRRPPDRRPAPCRAGAQRPPRRLSRRRPVRAGRPAGELSRPGAAARVARRRGRRVNRECPVHWGCRAICGPFTLSGNCRSAGNLSAVGVSPEA